MTNKSEPVVIWDAVTLTAGAADTVSGGLGLILGGAILSIEVLNGSTGPTLPAQVQVYVSHDGTKYFKDGAPLVADPGNDVATNWTHIAISQGYRYVKLAAGSNTGQDVTITAHLTEKM